MANADKGDSVAANPQLGIAKGIIAIVIGLLWLNNMAYGSLLSYHDTGMMASLVSGLIWGLVICGLLTRRGVLAIKHRRTTTVTRLNFGVWVAVLAATLVYIYFALR